MMRSNNVEDSFPDSSRSPLARSTASVHPLRRTIAGEYHVAMRRSLSCPPLIIVTTEQGC